MQDKSGATVAEIAANSLPRREPATLRIATGQLRRCGT